MKPITSAYLLLFAASPVSAVELVGGSGLPRSAYDFLIDTAIASGETSMRISSLERTPEEQSSAMLQVIAKSGVKGAKKLYGNAGDSAIDSAVAIARDLVLSTLPDGVAFDEDKLLEDSDAILAALKDASHQMAYVSAMRPIIENFVTGPSGATRTELMHVTPHAEGSFAFDIAPSSLHSSAVESYLRASTNYVSRVISPGDAEKGFHVEFRSDISKISNNNWAGSCKFNTGPTMTAELRLERDSDNKYTGVFRIANYAGQTKVNDLQDVSVDWRVAEISFGFQSEFMKMTYQGSLNEGNKYMLIKSQFGQTCTLSS